MSLSKTEFDSYAALGFNRIPLMREVLADLDTPLSVYLKLARGPYSYLFESVQGGEKWGRYSIIGLPARTLLRVSGNEVTVEKDGDIIERETAEDPLEYVRRFKARYSVPEIAGLPRFTGGLVGYFGYETIRYIEPRLGAMAKPDAVGAPDILLMVSDEVVVFDNLKGKLYVVIHVNPAVADAFNNANRRLDELVTRLGAALPRSPAPAHGAPVAEADFVSAFTQEGFEKAVARALDYIRAGDIMQVVLSQRLAIPFAAAPLDLYRALRTQGAGDGDHRGTRAHAPRRLLRRGRLPLVVRQHGHGHRDSHCGNQGWAVVYPGGCRHRRRLRAAQRMERNP